MLTPSETAEMKQACEDVKTYSLVKLYKAKLVVIITLWLLKIVRHDEPEQELIELATTIQNEIHARKIAKLLKRYGCFLGD